MIISLFFSKRLAQIPSIIARLEEPDTANEESVRVKEAVQELFQRASQTLEQCEVVLEEEKKTGEDEDAMLDVLMATHDDTSARLPIRASLLQSLSEKKVLNIQAWDDAKKRVADDILNMPQSFAAEAAANAIPLSTYIEQRIASSRIDDASLLDTFVLDYASQHAFCTGLRKCLGDWVAASETEILSRACTTLLSHPSAVAVWLLYDGPAAIVAPLASLFDEQELAQSSDSGLGSIFLLAQVVAHQGIAAGVPLHDILPQQTYTFLPALLRSSSMCRTLSQYSVEDQEIVANWIASLFGSDGISDDLLQQSPPQLLLRITPTLFSQAITANTAGIIDVDTLRSGLSYYVQDLLSFALPVALRWLLSEVQRCNATDHGRISGYDYSGNDTATVARRRTACLDVLASLLSAESCPPCVRALVASDVLRTLEDCHDKPDVCSSLPSLLQPHMQGFTQRRPALWKSIVSA